jgi:hypothetical protein
VPSGATPAAAAERVLAAALANAGCGVGLHPDGCAVLGELLDELDHPDADALPELLVDLRPAHGDRAFERLDLIEQERRQRHARHVDAAGAGPHATPAVADGSDPLMPRGAGAALGRAC